MPKRSGVRFLPWMWRYNVLRMPKFMKRSFLILFGLLLAMLLGEISLRLIYGKPSLVTNVHSKRVVAVPERLTSDKYHKPNVSFVYGGHPGFVKEFTVAGRWNSLGFNDKDYLFDKPENTFRIVVLGDSYVEALQVPLEKSFHKIMEKQLNEKWDQNFEVISFGVSGNGARRNFELLLEHGIKFEPDLVIMEFLEGNDVRNDSVSLQVLQRRQAEKLNQITPILFQPEAYQANERMPHFLRKSRLLEVVGQGIVNLKYKHRRKSASPEEAIPFDNLVYAGRMDKNWQRAWDITLEHILKGTELSLSVGADFVVVAFNETATMTEDARKAFLARLPLTEKFGWDLDHPRRIVRSFCADHKIRFLDLNPIFGAEARKGTPLHYPHDGHWNESGHQLAAQSILQYLTDQSLLPNRMN